jgi:hypothetical protein
MSHTRHCQAMQQVSSFQHHYSSLCKTTSICKYLVLGCDGTAVLIPLQMQNVICQVIPCNLYNNAHVLTGVLGVLTGVSSPEQVAQAVAEQISQQARQQSAEAGGEAPIPLLSALRNYMQRLNAMYRGDGSARFLNLPPIAAGVS